MDTVGAARRGTEAGLRAVITAAEEVVAAIDGREVACVLAVKCPEDTPGGLREQGLGFRGGQRGDEGEVGVGGLPAR